MEAGGWGVVEMRVEGKGEGGDEERGRNGKMKRRKHREVRDWEKKKRMMQKEEGRE